MGPIKWPQDCGLAISPPYMKEGRRTFRKLIKPLFHGVIFNNPALDAECPVMQSPYGNGVMVKALHLRLKRSRV